MSTILAYFDPGSGSLLVQTIAAGTAGFLVFAKFVWDQFAAKFRSKFRAALPAGGPRSAMSSLHPHISGAGSRGRGEKKSEHARTV